MQDSAEWAAAVATAVAAAVTAFMAYQTRKLASETRDGVTAAVREAKAVEAQGQQIEAQAEATAQQAKAVEAQARSAGEQAALTRQSLEIATLPWLTIGELESGVPYGPVVNIVERTGSSPLFRLLLRSGTQVTGSPFSVRAKVISSAGRTPEAALRTARCPSRLEASTTRSFTRTVRSGSISWSTSGDR